MSRERDPRAARYTQAKQAAAKWFAALTASHAAAKRAQLAAAEFTKIVNNAESREEEAFLATLAHWTSADVGVEQIQNAAIELTQKIRPDVLDPTI